MLSDDGQLVRRTRRGDQGAFRQLVDRHYRRVYGLAYGMLGHQQDAEDAAQETFLRAYRSLGTFDVTRPLKAWLAAIAVNCCRSHLSRRHRLPRLVEAVEDVPARPAAEPNELAEHLAEAVQELRPEYRAVFLLYHNQGFSYEQMAEALAKPVGTVKTWLHRTRQELLAKLVRRGVLDAEAADAV